MQVQTGKFWTSQMTETVQEPSTTWSHSAFYWVCSEEQSVSSDQRTVGAPCVWLPMQSSKSDHRNLKWNPEFGVRVGVKSLRSDPQTLLRTWSKAFLNGKIRWNFINPQGNSCASDCYKMYGTVETSVTQARVTHWTHFKTINRI